MSRRFPLDLTMQAAGLEIEHALMRDQVAVADIERLVIDQHSHDLAVGDVDDRLSGLGVAECGLGVRQGNLFVKSVEVRTRNCMWFALVEICPPPDVSIGESE